MAEYEKRDPMKLGEYFITHMEAMTAEGLHDKADIAAELAHRDMLIDSLTAKGVYDKAKLQVTIEEVIGKGVHAGLRKFCVSDEAHEAYMAISRMPEGEWEYVCNAVAEQIIGFIYKGTDGCRSYADIVVEKP